jgi:Aspartyl protease
VLIGDLGRLFNLDPEIEGILGEDFLSRFNYLLDRRGRKLVMEENDNLATVLFGTKVSFETRGGKIYVPAAGGGVRLLLDSGNPYLVLYEDVAARLCLETADSSAVSAVGSSIGSRAVRMSRLIEMEIGDSVLRNVEVWLSARGSGRIEDGFLPLRFFDSIYVNHLENFLIVNPQWKR